MLALDQSNTIEYNGVTYDRSHGGPFDRGSADSWYSRPIRPHYYPQGTYQGEPVTQLTPDELAAYLAGYAYNEALGGTKSWD